MKKLLALLLVVIIFLLAMGGVYLALVQRSSPKLFSIDSLKGSSIQVNEQNYTLNFQQHKKLLVLLNGGKKTTLLKRESIDLFEQSHIKAIILYRFSDPDWILIPLHADFSQFYVQSGKERYTLDIKHPRALQDLLNNAYDR